MTAILLNSLLPIFAVMALGYFAGFVRDIDNEHVGELNALVMDFALPASLFVATATTPWAMLLAQWSLLLTLAVSMLALYALSYWMQRRLFALGSSEASVQALTIRLPNYAAAGLPLIVAVFDASHTIYVALAVASGSILLSPLTLAIFEAEQGICGRLEGFGPCFPRRGALAAQSGRAFADHRHCGSVPPHSARGCHPRGLHAHRVKPRAVWRCSSPG